MSFLPIRVSTIRGDQPLSFDAYIKINEKQVLYLRKGDSFEGSRLKRLKEKKLKKMFIVADDEGNYRSYLSKNIEMAYDPKSTKSIETRAEIVQGMQQANAEAVIEDPGNAEVYAQAREDSGKFIEFLMAEDRALGHILSQENLDKNVAHHGVTVATIVAGIAKRIGGLDSRSLQMLSLGALIHDVEHFYTAIDIARPIKTFTPEEAKVYLTHPTDGGRRLAETRHMDSQVVKIIAQHEEFVDGTGFPVGLNKSQLDPLSTFVSCANAFDRLVTYEGLARKEAVKKLMIEKVGSFELAHLQAIGDMVNQMPDKA